MLIFYFADSASDTVYHLQGDSSDKSKYLGEGESSSEDMLLVLCMGSHCP